MTKTGGGLGGRGNQEPAAHPGTIPAIPRAKIECRLVGEGRTGSAASGRGQPGASCSFSGKGDVLTVLTHKTVTLFLPQDPTYSCTLFSHPHQISLTHTLMLTLSLTHTHTHPSAYTHTHSLIYGSGKQQFVKGLLLLGPALDTWERPQNKTDDPCPLRGDTNIKKISDCQRAQKKLQM